ncbi:MAG TPA: glycosyltransferase family 2 protein [Mucilaginibacter sp.]
MAIELPDLLKYRAHFQSAGCTYPLQAVPFTAGGLLQELPEPADTKKTGWPWTEEVKPEAYAKTTSWPKLTIVTPSYNQVAFIETTIRAVLLQNYPNLEYIIIDGGSTDGSVEIINKYAPWISFWESKTDNGQGHAINKGFSLASGKYYAWINSDDYYLPETVLKVVELFRRSGVAFIYGYALNWVADQNAFAAPAKMAPFADIFIRMPSLAQPACFWSSAIHQPIWEDLHCSLDYELWLRLVKGQKRMRIREPLAVAAVHEHAKTFDPKMKEKWEADHQLICSPDAHGPVTNWDKLMILYRIRNKIYNWLGWV